jgi:hypothetical protein
MTTTAPEMRELLAEYDCACAAICAIEQDDPDVERQHVEATGAVIAARPSDVAGCAL